MRLDHLQYHLSRRQLLGGAAKVGAAGAIASVTGLNAFSGVAGAARPAGPFVTRGVLIDVLGWKQSMRSGDVITVGGNKILSDTYRITLEDIRSTMKWEGVKGIEAGDVVIIRTGWNQLAESPDTYHRNLASEPGIHIREAKFFADHRPAVVGADSWALEVVGNTTLGPVAFPVHQIFLTKNGIRIGEGVISDELAEDGVHTFAYASSPQYAQGTTAGCVPPIGLAAARR